MPIFLPALVAFLLLADALAVRFLAPAFNLVLLAEAVFDFKRLLVFFFRVGIFAVYHWVTYPGKCSVAAKKQCGGLRRPWPKDQGRSARTLTLEGELQSQLHLQRIAYTLAKESIEIEQSWRH